MSTRAVLAANLPCWRCRLVRRAAPVVALWTWFSGWVDPVCQEHLDESLDLADDDPISEPNRVQWLDGLRTLVAA